MTIPFNHDPEVWQLTDTHGDRALRFVLEIFCLLDKKNNYLEITLPLMKSLARTLRQSLAKCWRILGQMLANGWLIVLKTFEDGSPSAVMGRNYAEYHRSRGRNGDELGTNSKQIGPDLVGKGREGSSLTLNSSLTSSEEEARLREQKEKKGAQSRTPKKEKVAHVAEDCAQNFELFWQAMPARNGKKVEKPEAARKFETLSPSDQVTIIQAAANYANSERARAGVGIKDPHRFIKSGKGDTPWRDWTEPEARPPA